MLLTKFYYDLCDYRMCFALACWRTMNFRRNYPNALLDYVDHGKIFILMFPSRHARTTVYHRVKPALT